MWEVLRQLGDLVFHQLIGLQFVGAGGQLDVHACGLHAVVAAEVVVVLAAQLNGGDVAQRHQRTVLIDPQGDLAELFRRLELRLGVDGGVQRLFIDRRRAAQLADRHLGVLRLNGLDHVLGRELVAVELVGIEPDAHGVLRAVHVHAADAVDTAERILQVGDDVIGNVLLVHAVVGGDERHHHQRGVAGFRHRDP